MKIDRATGSRAEASASAARGAAIDEEAGAGRLPEDPSEADTLAASSHRSERASWMLRARLLLQRFWQPTTACLTCMPGHVANVVSALHWEIALRTGLLTGALVLLLSFTRFVRVFRHRAGNAVAVGVLTVVGDASAHPDFYGHGFVEPLITGVVSGLAAYVAAWLLEHRARRIRSAWRRLTGR